MKSLEKMKKTRQQPALTLTESLNTALQQLEKRQTIPRVVLNTAQNALEALPLPTSRYARYLCNLRNAESYALRSEFGAAQYELRILLRNL